MGSYKQETYIMCLIIAVAIFFPRFILFASWLFNDWFDAYESSLWPFLGFIFAPYVTLAWMAAMLNHGILEGWWLVLFVVAIFADVGSWSSSEDKEE